MEANVIIQAIINAVVEGVTAQVLESVLPRIERIERELGDIHEASDRKAMLAIVDERIAAAAEVNARLDAEFVGKEIEVRMPTLIDAHHLVHEAQLANEIARQLDDIVGEFITERDAERLIEDRCDEFITESDAEQMIENHCDEFITERDAAGIVEGIALTKDEIEDIVVARINRDEDEVRQLAERVAHDSIGNALRGALETFLASKS